MKFNCGLSPKEKRHLEQQEAQQKEDYLQQWHKIFAIWPRRVAHRDCRVFEFIERRYVKEYKFKHMFLTVEYRAIEKALV